jgi:hypothetical protein
MILKTHARALGLLTVAFALSVPGAQAQTPANAPPPSSRANWPADVDRQSGFRLPLLTTTRGLFSAASAGSASIVVIGCQPSCTRH